MAIGYEKINTSAARAKRRSAQEIPREKIDVVAAGALVWFPVYGNGITADAFVSDCDKVLCRYDSGVEVIQRGGAVRGAIRDRANGIGQQ